MKNRDKIEYYKGNDMVASVISSMVPTIGSIINIKAVTYEVSKVEYALDHASNNSLCGMRANVDLVFVNDDN